MGEIVDMIMEGELCEECVGWIDDNAQGFPRKCSDCRPKKVISPQKRAALRAKRKRQRKRRKERENNE